MRRFGYLMGRLWCALTFYRWRMTRKWERVERRQPGTLDYIDSLPPEERESFANLMLKMWGY